MSMLKCNNDQPVYNTDKEITKAAFQVVHLVTLTHLTESNESVYPSIHSPQAAPDLCELH